MPARWTYFSFSLHVKQYVQVESETDKGRIGFSWRQFVLYIIEFIADIVVLKGVEVYYSGIVLGPFKMRNPFFPIGFCILTLFEDPMQMLKPARNRIGKHRFLLNASNDSECAKHVFCTVCSCVDILGMAHTMWFQPEYSERPE